MQKQLFVAFLALFSTISTVISQTPGMIYEPATGAGAAILDPNGDGSRPPQQEDLQLMINYRVRFLIRR